MTIKKGDTIIVRAGKNRGVKAKVLRVAPKDGTALVEGVNIVSRHEKKRREGGKGQIVKKPAPVSLSSLSVFCATCGKGVRLSAKIAGDKKLRVCATCGTEL